jgi:hypothetical protein
MTIYAGTVEHFGGSMADAIEQALGAGLFALKGTTLPESSAQERRLLFAAIAQGVLAYLGSHESDLTITIGDETFDLSIDYETAAS